jgi:hypothetical protein
MCIGTRLPLHVLPNAVAARKTASPSKKSMGFREEEEENLPKSYIPSAETHPQAANFPSFIASVQTSGAHGKWS